MSDINSTLVLQNLVFDKIEFNRKGFKNNEELKFAIQVQIGTMEDGTYKVTLILQGDKKEEYEFLVSLSGFFEIDKNDFLSDERKHDLINKNAVAILMPYLRSEVSILTAQPEVDCVVLPPFNINKMLDRNNKET